MGCFNPDGLVQAQQILCTTKLQALLPAFRIQRMTTILEGLAPHLNQLIKQPLSLTKTLSWLIEDYQRETKGCIHRVILHSMLFPFDGQDFIDFMLRIKPAAVYKAICHTVQKQSLPKQFLTELFQYKEDFSLIFDPNRALYLDCFQAIFRYLNLPSIPFPLVHQPIMLGEILRLTLERLVSEPQKAFERIVQCYSVMKRPPLIQLIQLQTHKEMPMKILNQSFQIECEELRIQPEDIYSLIKQLATFSQTRWAMLRTPSYLFLLTLPIHEPIGMQQIGALFLKEEVSKIALSQILLRLCDNQTSFNQKIKTLLGNFPISRHSFMNQVLSWSLEHEKKLVLEILDQEFSKIFFDEALCLEILIRLKITSDESKRAELIHEIMLAIGSANEYPIYLAQIIQKLLINHEIVAPSIQDVTAILCQIKHRPPPLIVGQHNDHKIGGLDTMLVLSFHFTLNRPSLFLMSGKKMHHLPFSEFETCEVIKPKTLQGGDHERTNT